MTTAATQARPLTAVEFLAWESEPGRRYELIDGQIIMMAPATRTHNILVFTLGRLLGNTIPRGRALIVEGQSGIVPRWRDDAWYEADVIVAEPPTVESHTCMVESPLVIAEGLSTTTSAKDRLKKLPDYRRLPSVRDILLIEQTAAFVQHHRREEENVAWTVETIRGLDGAYTLAAFPATVAMRDLYKGIPLG